MARLITTTFADSKTSTSHLPLLKMLLKTVTSEVDKFKFAVASTTKDDTSNIATTNSSHNRHKQHAAWLDILRCVVEEIELCLRSGTIDCSPENEQDLNEIILLLLKSTTLNVVIESARHPIGMCRSAAAQCLSMLHLFSRALQEVVRPNGEQSPESPVYQALFDLAADTSSTSSTSSTRSTSSSIEHTNTIDTDKTANNKEKKTDKKMATAGSMNNTNNQHYHVHGMETALGVLTSMMIVHSNMRYTPLSSTVSASSMLPLLLSLTNAALRHQNLNQSGKEGQLAAVAVGTLTLLRGTLQAFTLDDIATIHASMEQLQKESDNWHTRKQIPQVLMSFYMRHVSLYNENATATLERLLLVGLKDKKSVEVQEAASKALTMYLMTKGSGEDDKDRTMLSTYVPMFEELLSVNILRPHPSTETDDAKIQKRQRTIRIRIVKQRAGMLGLCAVVNAYPYRVPDFVPGILVHIARVVGASKGLLKTSLFSDFRKSKEDGWIHHKRKFTSEQYEFLQEYFLGGNYYA